MKSATKTKSKVGIAEGITHVEVDLSSFSDKAFDEARKATLLQAQGEPAETKESYPISILLVVLDALHRVSPELVLKTEHGRFLIFDHQSGPILRDKDIIEDLVREATHEEIRGAYVSNPEIDIEAVWQGAKGTDYQERTREALKKIKNLLRPSEVVTLIGTTPSLLFLLAYHLLYGIAGEVWHQEDKNSQAIRIR